MRMVAYLIGRYWSEDCFIITRFLVIVLNHCAIFQNDLNAEYDNYDMKTNCQNTYASIN